MDSGRVLYKKALSEIKKGIPNIEEVIRLLNESIQRGEPRAAYALGTWYLHGENVRKNRKKAVKLLKVASEKNVAEACYDLAICYEKGEGVEKDVKKAFELYLRAALYGDSQSFYEVGRCYYYGIGIDKNKDIADIWLEKAQGLGVDLDL